MTQCNQCGKDLRNVPEYLASDKFVCEVCTRKTALRGVYVTKNNVTRVLPVEKLVHGKITA